MSSYALSRLDSLRFATSPIFHYTSSASLLGITGERRLRASEAASLNDLAEVRSGWGKIREWLSKQNKTSTVGMLRGFAEEPLKAEHEVFICCCSTSGDDANQWRLYGDGARGYAVQPAPSKPLAVASDVYSPTPKKPSLGTRADGVASVTPWLHVIYTEAEFENAMSELLNMVESDVLAIGSGNGWDEDARTEAYEMVQDDAYEMLAGVAHLVKATGFSGENEVRAVATLVLQEKHTQFRPSANGVVGYVELTEAPADHGIDRIVRPAMAGAKAASELSIESVRLGPLLRAERANTVRGLLRKSKFDASILTSDVHLR